MLQSFLGLPRQPQLLPEIPVLIHLECARESHTCLKSQQNSSAREASMLLSISFCFPSHQLPRCLTICQHLFIYLLVYLFVYRFVYPPICRSVGLSTYRSVHLNTGSIYRSVYLSLSRSIHPIRLAIHLSIYRSICQIYQSSSTPAVLCTACRHTCISVRCIQHVLLHKKLWSKS